jgi:hypothetical protein
MNDTVKVDEEEANLLADTIISFIEDTFPRHNGVLLVRDVCPAMLFAFSRIVARSYKCDAAEVATELRNVLMKYGVFKYGN